MTFKIDTDYYIVELNSPAPDAVLSWVQERFGDGSDGRWSYLLDKFYFASHKDHMMFILKWS